jgi:low temperature requirement protein LtrA
MLRLDRGKLGSCVKCMVLSFALALLGAAALTLALNYNIGYLTTPGSLATGSFGTLSLLHIISYAKRRVGKAPTTGNKPCCD